MAHATHSPKYSGNNVIVGPPQLSAADSEGARLVRFSLLYKLRHRAYSITARNSVSSERAQSWPSPPHAAELYGHCTAYANNTPHGETGEAADLGYMTPPQRGSRPTSTELFVRRSPSSVALSPLPSTNATVPLLSTMDKRELSKVVVRDAVFGRLLDLVPSRQHIQTAIWTLSSNVIQIDGAVAVRAMPRDGCNGHPFSGASHLVASRGGSSAYADVEGLCDVVRERVGELVVDAQFFACLLQPYLGDIGCQGDVIQASVDVVG